MTSAKGAGDARCALRPHREGEPRVSETKPGLTEEQRLKAVIHHMTLELESFGRHESSCCCAGGPGTPPDPATCPDCECGLREAIEFGVEQSGFPLEPPPMTPEEEARLHEAGVRIVEGLLARAREGPVMSDEASTNHPHGFPSPEWIAPNGSCALCALEVGNHYASELASANQRIDELAVALRASVDALASIDSNLQEAVAGVEPVSGRLTRLRDLELIDLDIRLALLMGAKWWRSSVTGRRCLYMPGREPSWMQTPATGNEPLVSDWHDGRAFVPAFSMVPSVVMSAAEMLRRNGRIRGWSVYSEGYLNEGESPSANVVRPDGVEREGEGADVAHSLTIALVSALEGP